MNLAESYHTALSDEHLNELQSGSAIDPSCLTARGVRTAYSKDEIPGEFAEYQRRPGIIFPLWDVHGNQASYQLKPDKPRKPKGSKKPLKYETPAGSKNIIDVPPAAHSHLMAMDIPLWITEGPKKADSGVSNGIQCIVSIQGVYGWCTRINGESRPLPDWRDGVALKGRDVVLAFDSDCSTKRDVQRGLTDLKLFLEGRGAIVRILILPDLPDGSKCGLDDWFANGGVL